MATLLQTLRLAGALTTVDDDLGGTGFAGTTGYITAAGAKDGSDATMHSVIAGDDSGNGFSGHVVTSVFGAVDAFTAEGTIEFVRVKVRSRLAIIGPGPSNDFVAFYYGGNLVYIDQPGAAFADLVADLTTKPGSGGSWDAAALATGTIGFAVNLQNNDPTFQTVAQCDVSEFALEVWGSAGPVAKVTSSFGAVIMPGSASGVVDRAVYGDSVGPALASGVVEG